jgi:hypothetical protein
MILIIITIAYYSLQKCAFYQTDSHSPPMKYPTPIDPFIIQENKACPYYSGVPACCNDVQIEAECPLLIRRKL